MSTQQESKVARERVVYPTPPIAEALCQFNFAQPLEWSPVLPGLFYNMIRSTYPQKPEVQQQLQANVMLPTDGSGEAQFNMGPGEQRLLFANEDRTRLVALAPTSLSVNSLPPYEGWPALHDRTAEVLRRVHKELRGTLVQVVSVRYINRVSLPWPSGTMLSNYFNVPYRVVGPSDASLDQILLRQESSIGDGSVKGVRTFTRVEAENETSDAASRDFVLDLEFAKMFATPVTFDEALESADELKALENAEFEACITDETRRLFG